MKKKPNPALIGAFVLGAIAIVVIALVMLGSAAWFSTTYRFALYFEDSVDGLVVGAPVKFKGVQIGSVQQILLAPGAQLDQPRIEVIISLDESRIESLGGTTAGFSAEDVREAVARGLRARLASQSLLTGLLYVSLNYEPDAPPPPMPEPDAPYAQIPTVPSRVEQLAQTANDIFKKLTALDWQGLFDSISDTMDGLRKLVASPETQEVTRELNAALESVQQLADKLSSKVDPISDDLDALARELKATLGNVDAAVAEVEGAFQADSPLTYRLENALAELEMAARSVRELANSLDRNPSQVLFGRE